MGAIPGMLGIGPGGNRGSAGAKYSAEGTDIDKPATVGQATKTYDESQKGLDLQMAFLQALQAQNGIQNQADVYNRLTQVAEGNGPNPALAQLNNATGQNVSNQAALMAGQRGASTNVGLIARQNALQGAQIQQQAAGQGAALQANQQMNAIGQMGGLASQQVGQQAGAVNSYNQFAQGEQANILNSIAAQNNAAVGMQSNINNANAGIAQVVAKGQTGFAAGALGAAGAGAQAATSGGGAAAAAHGGLIEKYADGGAVSGYQAGIESTQAKPGPTSKVGQILNKSFVGSPQAPATETSAGSDFGKGLGTAAYSLGKAIFSPGQPGAEQPLPTSSGAPTSGSVQTQDIPMKPMAQNQFPATEMDAKGGVIKGEQFASKGKQIPGKAKVKGDSYANDTVKAVLSPGEIIIPRSIAQGEDAPRKAAEFVAAVLSKKRHS